MMSLDELMARLSVANCYKVSGSMYIVSPTVYERMNEAAEHYMSTGDIVYNETYQQFERTPVDK